MAQRIDLIRHPKKKEKVFQGSQTELTQEGAEQIDPVLDRLTRLPHQLIVCSNAPRTRVLADEYADRLGYVAKIEDGLFNENEKPDFLLGLRKDDRRFVDIMGEYRAGFDDNRVPSMDFIREVWEGFTDRPPPEPKDVRFKTRAELEDIMRFIFMRFHSLRGPTQEEAHTALVVTHLRPIARCFHWIHQGGTLEGFYRTTDDTMIFDTTGITTLLFMPHRRTGEMRWHIAHVNDVAHYHEAEIRKFDALLEPLYKVE